MPAGRALVLAPGARLREAAALTVGPVFNLTYLDWDDAGSDEQLGSELEGAGIADVDLLIVGDGVFAGQDPDETLGVGLRRAFCATKLAVRGMLRRHQGQIIAVAPGPNASCVPHFAAQEGLGGFIKSVAREVGSRGISAYAVLPAPRTGEASPEAADPGTVSASLASALKFLTGPDRSVFAGHILWIEGSA